MNFKIAKLHEPEKEFDFQNEIIYNETRYAHNLENDWKEMRQTMGLFGFGKKKQGDVQEEAEIAQSGAGTFAGGMSGNKGDFVFEIQKAFPYKEHGSVLIGRVQSGELLPGTKVSYTDGNGRAIFNCTINEIEQNRFKAKKASACQFGLFGPVFSMVVSDFAPNAFAPGNFLRLRAEAEKELSPLQEAFENCRLKREREEEIRAALGADELAAEVYAEYSVQEMIFALTCVRDQGAKVKEKDGEEAAAWKAKSDQLYPAMLEKLRKLNKVYVTVDKSTNFPFLNNGFVDVYSKEEYAELAVLYYKEQFRELKVQEMPVAVPEPVKTEDGKPVPAQMPAFMLFYYLGMERVLLDDGLYRAAIGRGDVLAPPNFSGKPVTQVPVTNPALRFHMLDFFGEARWKVNYEKRGEVLQAKERVMLTEIVKAKFLIPMKYDGAARQKPGTNQILFDKNTKLMFATLKNAAGETYTPVFTDFTELGKMYQPKEWGAAVISIHDAIGINKGDGIVVNAAGENLVLKEKAIEAMKEIAKQLKEAGTKPEKTQEADTKPAEAQEADGSAQAADDEKAE